MENLARYSDKFSESGRRILETALAETQRCDQHLISPEHILFALIKEESELFKTAMRDSSIDLQDVQLAVEKRLANSPKYSGEGFEVAPQTTEIFKYSIDKARAENRQVIEAGDICHVIATWKSNVLEEYFVETLTVLFQIEK